MSQLESRLGIRIGGRDREALDLGGHSTLDNSCLWFFSLSALTTEDVKAIDQIRRRRNHIAHELPQLLVSPEPAVSIEHLQELQTLLRKIEIWWVKNIELSTDPDYIHKDLESLDVETFYTVLFDHVMEKALKLNLGPS